MNRIKELRKIKGINQIELANLLDVSQQTISTYENGNRDPDVSTLRVLSKLFNVSIDYLIGETDVEDKYDDVNSFICSFKETLKNANYDISEKSAKEIAEIAIDVLILAEKIKWQPS